LAEVETVARAGGMVKGRRERGEGDGSDGEVFDKVKRCFEGVDAVWQVPSEDFVRKS